MQAPESCFASSQRNALAAAIVGVGEWCCLDAAISRLAGLWAPAQNEIGAMQSKAAADASQHVAGRTGVGLLLDLAKACWADVERLHQAAVYFGDATSDDSQTDTSS